MHDTWRERASRKGVSMGHSKLLMPVLPSAADSDLMQIRQMQVECRQWCQQYLGDLAVIPSLTVCVTLTNLFRQLRPC